MQNILSIDITGKNLIAAIVAVDDKVSILEQYELSLSLIQENNDPQSEQDEEESHTIWNCFSFENFASALEQLVNLIQNSYTRSVLIIPSNNYFSTSLSVPFLNQKAIEKILDLEIQDIIPFDITDFHVSQNILNSTEDGDYEIHASVISKELIFNLLQSCKKFGIEPYIITTRATTLANIFQLTRDKLDTNNIALIDYSDSVLSICILKEGEPYYDRMIKIQELSSTKQNVLSELDRQVKLTLIAFEHKYSVKLDSLFYLNYPPLTRHNFGGSLFNSTDDTDQTDLETVKKALDPRNILNNSSMAFIWCAAAAMYAKDYSAPIPLTNFRVRTFAYRQQFKECFSALKVLMPYCIVLLVLLSIMLFIIYKQKDVRIHNTSQAIEQEISHCIPTLGHGSKIDEVLQKREDLERELKNLKSETVLTPLEAYSAISSDIALVKKKNKELTISSLRITQNRAVFMIQTQEYEGKSLLERVLRRKKDLYCNVTSRETGSGRSISKNFEFSLEFCKK